MGCYKLVDKFILKISHVLLHKEFIKLIGFDIIYNCVITIYAKTIIVY